MPRLDQDARIVNEKTWVAWAQDMLALNSMLEGTGSTIHPRNLARAQKILERAGVEAGGGAYANALAWLSQRGGTSARAAAGYVQQIEMKNLDTQAATASRIGSDDIARAYQNMGQQFTGMLGADVDVGSPAVLDTARRYVEGRSSDTARYLSNIEGQRQSGRNAILAGQVAPTLIGTGELIEAFKMLDQEQEALRRAQYLNAGVQLGSSVITAFA